MNLLRASANRLSACGRALRPWLGRTLSPLRCSIQADRQALPRGSHAERPVQGSRRQEYWAADARGPRAQQAGKLETWALFAGSQGGTVAPAGGNTCAPRSPRLDLKAPVVPRLIRSTPDHLSRRTDWHRCQWQGRRGLPSPLPGFVVRGCRRAFLVAGGRDVTAVELFAWCYARRAQRKRVRLSVRDGDETFPRSQECVSRDTKGYREDGSESRQSVARRQRVASAWGKVRV
jgi:hypothetical protein